MVKQKLQFRSYDPDPDGFDYPSDAQPEPYRFGRTAHYDGAREEAVPLFLSDPDSEPEPEEFIAPLRKRRFRSLSSKILMAVVAAAGAAMLFAWSSSDATRNVIVDAKASMAAMVTPSAQADAAQLTPSDIQLKDAARANAPAPQPPQAASIAPAAPSSAPIVLASASPSQEQITNAYQNALRGAAPAVIVPAATAPTPVAAEPNPSPSQARHIDNDELATLMKRARDMLGAGDVPAARLLLERAAEGGDAGAALLLARTYDPQVLGNSDVRNIVPEPDKARRWYRRAAQYGSVEAERRLAQLSN